MVTRTSEAHHQILALPLAPPRRLAPGAHYRSFKNQADREVWAQAWQRVQEMEADGWQVERVEVDFGKTLPLMPSAAEEWLQAMCPGAPAVSWVWSGVGRGETRVFLVRRCRGCRETDWPWGDEMNPSPLYLELERRRNDDADG